MDDSFITHSNIYITAMDNNTAGHAAPQHKNVAISTYCQNRENTRKGVWIKSTDNSRGYYKGESVYESAANFGNEVAHPASTAMIGTAIAAFMWRLL